MPNVRIVKSPSFAELRQQGGYYVDKTGFIESFLTFPGNPNPNHYCPHASATLLMRPRRFGKSLLMSMLAEFFDISKDSRELFAGLKVMNNKRLCEQWMNQYPVVLLSLQNVKGATFEEAMDCLRKEIALVCTRIDPLLDREKLGNRWKFWENNKKRFLASDRQWSLSCALYAMTHVLHAQFEKRTIVLVDEYDAPLVCAAEHGYYEEMHSFIGSFLGEALKTNFHLKFGIFTGCLRYMPHGLGSGFNNFSCEHLADFDRYASYFGFTQDEVDRLLLDAALFPRRQEFREWYGGYHMSGLEESYCPASVMDYLCDVQDNPDTSPRVYMDYSLEKNLIEQLTEGDAAFNVDRLMGVQTDIDVCIEYNEERLWRKELLSRLLFAGFLTGAPDYLEEDIQRAGAYMKILSVPNREVREIFACVVQQGR